MGKLQEAIDLVKAKFPSEWWLVYGFDKSREEYSELPNKIEEFKILIDEVEENIFDCLNLSIIRGEYLEETNHKDLIILLKGHIENLRPTFIPIDDEVSGLLFEEEFISGFIEPLKLAINFYLEFFLEISRGLNLSLKEYIQAGHNTEIQSSLLEGRSNEDSEKNINLLALNIRIARCDHKLSLDNNQLNILTDIKLRLSSSSIAKPYTPLLSMKAGFLINKLKIRLLHQNKGKLIFSVVNGEERQVSVAEMLDQNVFDEWLEYANVHYQLKDGWEAQVSLNYESLKSKSLDKCSLYELHQKIKYYKDVHGSYPGNKDSINDIIKEIKSRENKCTSICDGYAYSIAINYATNNVFSLACGKKGVSIEDVEKEYNATLSSQSTTMIKNFFPQTKYLDFLLKQLQKLYDDRKVLNDINGCRQIIEKCRELYKPYEDNVNWTKRNYNYVFQLPFLECCISIQDTNTDRIFVFSSFLLPLVKEQYVKDFNDNRSQVAQLEASVRVFENVETELSAVKTFKEELKGVQNSIRDREIKTMEILGVFTAIISFVAAALPTFRVIDTPMEAALFMLALATSFAVFVLLLLTAFRGVDKLKKNGGLIISGFITAIILWGSLIYLSQNNYWKSLINEPKSTPIETDNKIYQNYYYQTQDTIGTTQKVLNTTLPDTAKTPPQKPKKR